MRDIVCISHLRWDFVWQRPQQLLSRLSQQNRVIFVEEPLSNPALDKPRLNTYVWQGAQAESVEVIQLMQPAPEPRWIGHGDELTAETYNQLLRTWLKQKNIRNPILWLYTPMAAAFIDVVEPSLLVYDVMDQLAAFKGAPVDLARRDATVLRQADIVFTGGVSLYRDKLPANINTYLFPSGVDSQHFAMKPGTKTALPPEIQALKPPLLGYFGVIDERIDTALLAHLASEHPEWNILMIGPVVKIGYDELPQAPNIHYLGMKSYAELPAYLAHFDVALVPFALNEATRYLSPTKVLEYMAAHKPIVSTPIHDVIELYGSVVQIGHNHAEFAAKVEAALTASNAPDRLVLENELLTQHSWGEIAKEMHHIMEYMLRQRMIG